MALKSVKKFLMNIFAVLGLPRCIPSGSIAAKNVALMMIDDESVRSVGYKIVVVEI